MKNSLIYILIGIMIVALFGSITIQSIWILDAAENKEAELEMHANDALNQLNQKIAKKEANKFLDLRYGGVDSLVNEVMFIQKGVSDEEKESIEDIVIIDDNNGIKKEVRIAINSGDSVNATLEMHPNHKGEGPHKNHKLHEIHNKLVVKMESIHKDLGNMFHWTGGEDEKLEDIASVVEHFTYEKLFGHSLQDRIEQEELKEILDESLKKEGIQSDFEYAVYNNEENEIEKGYQTKGFDPDKSSIKKALFPDDNIKENKYEIALQISDADVYVWESIHPMIWSSVLFTVLILIAFSYSLYFIFKQKKISRIKNDFINNMTHELKTPLASISLAASSIKHPDVVQNKEQVEEFVDIIETERVRMNSHIEKVLDIAALENNDLTLSFERSDLKLNIEKAIKNLKLPLEQVDGSIAFKTNLDEVWVQADTFHFNNALTNVIENSIKYRKEAPVINIELIDGTGFYKIIIKDNGIGMTKKSVKLAFDKFYREESGNIHNRKGFGLGLSYVKSIVEAHKGMVQLKSEVNKGTEVIITIPKIND